MKALLAVAFAFATAPLFAQTDDIDASSVRAVSATGAMLRQLDKLNGTVGDLGLAVGETGTLGRLRVRLGDCRYPEDNQGGEAYAWLTVTDPDQGTTLFDGWMIASSPALNALDHPRYDVWVIRCTTA